RTRSRQHRGRGQGKARDGPVLAHRLLLRRGWPRREPAARDARPLAGGRSGPGGGVRPALPRPRLGGRGRRHPRHPAHRVRGRDPRPLRGRGNLERVFPGRAHRPLRHRRPEQPRPRLPDARPARGRTLLHGGPARSQHFPRAAEDHDRGDSDPRPPPASAAAPPRHGDRAAPGHRHGGRPRHLHAVHAPGPADVLHAGPSMAGALAGAARGDGGGGVTAGSRALRPGLCFAIRRRSSTTSREDHMDISGRRRFLHSATPALLFAAASPAPVKKPAPSKKEETEEEVTPTEDLMREHGLLKRVLLVYDEVHRRIGANEDFAPETVAAGARIIRAFIEEYHEELEERHLFPRFRSHHTLVDLATGGLKGADDKKDLAAALASFVRMYAPHEAREDTVLFPALRGLVSAN